MMSAPKAKRERRRDGIRALPQRGGRPFPISGAVG